MSKTNIIFHVLIVTFSAGLHQVTAKDGFIATLPEVLRHQSQSEFCMTMYSQGQTRRSATFTMVDTKSGDKALEIQENYTPGVQKCSQFAVPVPGDYELLLYNETDIIHDTVDISVQEDKPLTLVQSDKPMYKPGQTVKFRILTLLYNMKPRIGQIASVYIMDPNDIRVKQYLDIDTKGLVSLEFKLVDRAKLGDWKIVVDIENSGKDHSISTFEVKEYVLPRFEVTISPPLYILGSDKEVQGQVCAKYTYSKAVTGFLELKVWWGHSGMPPTSQAFHQIVEMNGCHNFTADISQVIGELPTMFHIYGNELQIEASVTEVGTGAIVNKSNSGPSISHQALDISIEDYTNGFFKPGIPYFGKVIVKHPDGSPVSNELISVHANGDSQSYKNNFTTDDAGIIVFALCNNLTENITNFGINVEAINHEENEMLGMYKPSDYRRIKQWFSPSLSYIQIPKIETPLECGNDITLTIPFTTKTNRDVTFTYQVLARGQIIKKGQVVYHHMDQDPEYENVTPSEHQCLQYEVRSTVPPPPGVPIEVLLGEGRPPIPYYDDIQSTDEGAEDDDENDGEQYYTEGSDVSPPSQKLYNEPVVRSEMVSDTMENFILNMKITTEMSPRFTLLMYHVLPDGEVVADSMDYNVKPCFANDVSMKFKKTKALPGEEVDLSLQASPGSLCGVGVVDKSVNIMGGDHQITTDVVFERIEELSRPTFGFMPYMREDDYCEQKIKTVKEVFTDDKYYWFYTSKYVDAIQAFKSSGFRVLTNLELETRPCQRTPPIFYDYPVSMRGNSIEQVPGPGGPMPVPSIAGYSSANLRIRSNFPETWLWSLHIVGEEGETNWKETVPDTVTSWVGNALCMDQVQGFGVSPLTSLTTFQPFFVSLHLPYSAVRGERLPVILTIFNYLEKCLNIQLSLEVGSAFAFHNSGSNKIPFCLCGGKSHSSRYYITPKSTGSLAVVAKAEAVAGMCGNSVDMDTEYVGHSDAVKRTLLTKAEGVTQTYSHSLYMCSNDDKSDSSDVILPLPKDMVKNSQHGEVKVIGDIMGPAMSNLNNLVNMPTGCGEQNMVGFVPNICVLKYLSNTNRLEDNIEKKALKHMEIGYQNELTYRHKDGSYSAFGERDERGSVWLTAFVVKSFAQARPYIYVDEAEIALSLSFLRRSQLENGCFRETGKVFSSYMMGGLSKGKMKNSFAALTAYVVSALIHADVDPDVNRTGNVIRDGLECLSKEFQTDKDRMDPYSLALVAYVNTLYRPHSHLSAQLMKTLDNKARKEGSSRHWSRETPKPKSVNTWYYYAAPSAEVEMTAYALLANINFYGEQAVSQTHDIAMWLSQQRNPQGGFASTQDTVIGLQALSEFAELAYSGEDTNMAINVSGQGIERQFIVSEAKGNTLLLQSETVSKLPNRIEIQTSGKGCALVQTSVSYNKPANKMSQGRAPFYLKVIPKLYQHDIDRCDRRTLYINLKLRNRKFSNGMSLLRIKMVTGWSPMADSLIKMKSMFPVLGIKQHEHNEVEGILTFYFDELTRKAKVVTLDIEQDRELALSKPKPAEVHIFQYYETDVTAVKSYNVKTTCGTKQEIPRKKKPQGFGNDLFPAQVREDISSNVERLMMRRKPDSACPFCSPLRKIPTDLKSYVCSSSAVYKAVAGRRGKKPMKIRQDIKHSPKPKNINKFVKFQLPEGCECNELKAPTKRVLLFMKEKFDGKNIRFDSSSVVLMSNKKIDKQVRTLLNSCK